MSITLLFTLLACTEVPSSAPPTPAAEAEHHAHHGDGATVHHRFDDAERWSKTFDDPERDAWQKPTLVVDRMGISPGMTVADIGAGTGYFNAYLAKAVGPSGRVIASDIEPNLIAFMQRRAEKDQTPQVEARLGKPSDPELRPGEVDRILLVDTYHHIDDRKNYFARLRPAVKPDGKLVIVDFREGELPVGPRPDHKLSKAQVLDEVQEAGWLFEADVDGLDYQYILVFTPRSP